MVALLGISGATPRGVPVHQRANLSVENLRWLAGCLELREGDRVVEEHRMDLRAGSMLGMARTTTSKSLGEYELTLIHQKASQVLFEAHPSGQAAAVFAATSANADSVIFEAPEHDYPQIVGYRRSGRDSVIAWIDGKQGGKRQRIEFPYRRVPCPGKL
jgi:hypothetical protein